MTKTLKVFLENLSCPVIVLMLGNKLISHCNLVGLIPIFYNDSRDKDKNMLEGINDSAGEGGVAKQKDTEARHRILWREPELRK